MWVYPLATAYSAKVLLVQSVPSRAHVDTNGGAHHPKTAPTTASGLTNQLVSHAKVGLAKIGALINTHSWRCSGVQKSINWHLRKSKQSLNYSSENLVSEWAGERVSRWAGEQDYRETLYKWISRHKERGLKERRAHHVYFFACMTGWLFRKTSQNQLRHWYQLMSKCRFQRTCFSLISRTYSHQYLL